MCVSVSIYVDYIHANIVYCILMKSMCRYTYICIYVYECVHLCMHTCKYIYIYIYIYYPLSVSPTHQETSPNHGKKSISSCNRRCVSV